MVRSYLRTVAQAQAALWAVRAPRRWRTCRQYRDLASGQNAIIQGRDHTSLEQIPHMFAAVDLPSLRRSHVRRASPEAAHALRPFRS